jgi:hypothetical protein
VQQGIGEVPYRDVPTTKDNCSRARSDKQKQRITQRGSGKQRNYKEWYKAKKQRQDEERLTLSEPPPQR